MTKLVHLLGCPMLAGALACGGDAGGALDGDVSGVEFCAVYGDVCGYGEPPERFQEEEDCVEEYNRRSTARQECMVEHLGLAEDDPDLHCPHVTSEGPCS